VASTCNGPGPWVRSPLPSWPNWFEPQHHKTPSDRAAHECVAFCRAAGAVRQRVAERVERRGVVGTAPQYVAQDGDGFRHPVQALQQVTAPELQVAVVRIQCRRPIQQPHRINAAASTLEPGGETVDDVAGALRRLLKEILQALLGALRRAQLDVEPVRP